MNATSASPAEISRASDAGRNVLVWDVPVRVFHWLMVLCFFGAYITAESERWRLVHVTLGYTVAGLVVFRLLWGVVGTRYARFANFVRGPRAVVRYFGSLLRGHPEPAMGHNPAGAVAIVALLALAAAVSVSGWAIYNDVGGGWVEDVHESAANLMLAVVGVHVAGVLVSSWLHRENLVGAMIDGRKRGDANAGVRRAWRSVAALMLATVLAFWALQWRDAGSGGVTDGASPPAVKAKKSDRDHD